MGALDKIIKFLNEQKEGFGVDIEARTNSNTNWREVLFTDKEIQLVVMSVPPAQELGMETHPHTSQFFRSDGGEGKAIIGGKEFSLSDGDAVVIPSNIEHNIINTSGTEDLKLYTLYAPPHHPPGTIDKTHADELIRTKNESRKVIREQSDIEGKIVSFFKKNPNPNDDDIHAFAESNGINPHRFEEIIYKMLAKFISNS